MTVKRDLKRRVREQCRARGVHAVGDAGDVRRAAVDADRDAVARRRGGPRMGRGRASRGRAMTLEQARRAFAEEVRAVAHLQSEPLVEAFARVPRERFLGAGPWQIARPLDPAEPYRTTPDDDPRHIYHDGVVALDPAR